MKRKITVTTGSRAEYGFLRPVIKSIADSSKLELFLIVTGMHLSKKHGMTIKNIKKDGFKIYKKVKMSPKDDSTYSMSLALGKGIIKFSKIFQKLKPDINVILGDRDEALASALAASHMNIPNCHIHGGDKSQAGIDEYNRHAITKISNIHFAATKKSKQRILKMGEDPKYVFVTGSPTVDEFKNNKITNKKTLEKKYHIKFTGNEILLIQHPVTTENKLSGEQITNILKAIVKTKKTTLAIAPNSDAGNQLIFNKLKIYSKKYPFIKMFLSIPRNDYLGFLTNCKILVGNSSSGIIESSYFNLPVVNIGIRQRDRERGKNVIDVENYSVNSIYRAIINSFRKRRVKIPKKDLIYGTGKASKKIVNVLEKIKLRDDIIKKQIFY